MFFFYILLLVAYERYVSVVACQRYVCPNVISMTMNVIIQECIIENCCIELSTLSKYIIRYRYRYYIQIIVMLINIQPHLIFVLYLCSVTSQSLSLSRDCQVPSSITTSRAASRHKNLHVKSPRQLDRVTFLMCLGRELE